MSVFAAPSMMDEIDLQLCLEIDPIIPGTPRPKLRPEKRSAPEAADDAGPPSVSGTFTFASHRVGISNTHIQHNNNDGHHHHHRHHTTIPQGNDGQQVGDRERERDPELYLALPPRKRVRTSLSVPVLGRKSSLQLEDRPDQIAEGGSEVDVMRHHEGGVGDAVQHLKRTSLPSGLQVLHGGADMAESLEHRVAVPASVLVRGMDNDVEMDINDGQEEESLVQNDDHVPPHFQIQDLMHHRPQAPFVYFPEGPYFPAVSDTLSPRGASSGRTTRFAIYEDTEDFLMDMDMNMEVDGESERTWLTWYLSPDDNKENSEEDHQDEQLQSQENGQVLGPEAQDYEHHFAFSGAGMGSYAQPSIEQRAYHNNDISSQHLADYASTPSREDPLEESSNLYQNIHMNNNMPIHAPIGTGNEHSLPSTSFLSATEMSLQSLPGQSSPRRPTSNIRSRRSRRTIRSLNIV
ncbi:hypothetical protein BJX64DRAFT_21156 [Aspergillus heterothallicus]